MTLRRAYEVFRDYESLAVPASGKHNLPSRNRELLEVWSNAAISITSAASPYGVSPNDIGGTIVITGTSSGTVILGGVGSYLDGHINAVVNKSSRRWIVAVDGIGNLPLWPGQSMTVFNSRTASGAAWNARKPSRWSPAGTTNIYVDANVGSDLNDGLAAGAGNAVQNIQAAVDRIQSSFDGSFNIQLAAAVHLVGSGVFVLGFVFGADQITITGDTANPAGYNIRCAAGGICISAQDKAIVTVSGVTFSTLGAGSTAVQARQQAIVDLNVCNFEDFRPGIHMECTTNASINILAGYTINANVGTHIRCLNNAYQFQHHRDDPLARAIDFS